MNINILNDLRNPIEEQFEVVERKGRGHLITALNDKFNFKF